MVQSIIIGSSMKFINEVQQAKKVLEGYSFSVTIPEISSLDTDYERLTLQERIDANHQLIVEYQNKIQNTDAILIWNQEKNSIPGYIGPNTFLEMVTGFNYNKPIFILNPISTKMNGYEEMMALRPICIHNNPQELKEYDPIN